MLSLSHANLLQRFFDIFFNTICRSIFVSLSDFMPQNSLLRQFPFFQVYDTTSLLYAMIRLFLIFVKHLRLPGKMPLSPPSRQKCSYPLSSILLSFLLPLKESILDFPANHVRVIKEQQFLTNTQKAQIPANVFFFTGRNDDSARNCPVVL